MYIQYAVARLIPVAIVVPNRANQLGIRQLVSNPLLIRPSE